MARSDRAFPVAVIVPSAALRAELPRTRASEARLLADIRLWAAHLHMRPLELPRAVRVEWQPWEPEAAPDSSPAPMTATLKKVRAVLERRYGAARDELYAEADSRAAAETTADDALAPSPCAVSAPLRALLPPALAPDARLTFSECGGDSLAAIVVAAALERAGVRVSAAALQDYPLGHLDALLAAATAGAALPPAAPAVRVVDWDAETTLAADWPPPSPPLLKAAEGSTGGGGLFLTGCTGFIGPLLVAEALKAPELLPPHHPTGAPIYCLVRGSSNTAAQARLEDAARHAGVPLPGHDCGDAAGAAAWGARVRVFAGDVALPRFGLSDLDWDTVRSNIRAVVHSGATVDMLQASVGAWENEFDEQT